MLQLVLISILGHFEGQLLLAEFHVFGWDETIKENVDAFTHREGHRHHTVDTLDYIITDERKNYK